MSTARQVPVEELEPGMKTLDWEVIGKPFKNRASREVAVDMRHRVDRGESTIWYDAGHLVTVIDEDESKPNKCPYCGLDS